MSVGELQTRVTSLSAAELTSFSKWFKEYLSDQWDRQIEADAQSGKLDALYAKLAGEDGPETKLPLDEVVNNQELSH